ncbi:MAG: valine--tRNA ligase, partial [Clostridia bacterium]|nr:valine--tRNA ligase [Clostridia bacterium]
MEKTYDPKQFEDSLYATWVEKGYFTPTIDPKKDPYTIVIPPPNITGQLHMGHALNNTLQDIMVRFKRMQGYPTLWLPGTDHASIATEVKIVDKLKAEGTSKEALGREGFLKAAWEWKRQYGGRIVEQLKKLGSSLDWTREAFTMDDRCNKAVKKVFVNLYNKGLIYRGSRIINWCPCCKTALSDAEVEYSEQDSFLWDIKYPLTDGSGYIVVATTRPETMFGDTAVAVNPKDDRYADMIGKTLSLPLTDRKIPIVADEYVEMDFGSGAVKITPAHDPNDFEVGMRHGLEVIRVMNDDGTMNEKAGAAYAGLDRMVARKKVEEDLAAAGLLVNKEPYKHNVGECYRCHSSVEPIISKQWFVKMKPLAEPAIKVVKDGEIEFIPERFSKVYFGWMENIKDWCISRQLWWGHRIPAYYCAVCGETIVSEAAPTKCPKCGGTHFNQDEDVLDTWFSSALWPFSTLGYPDKTEDLTYFYPTSVLITAYDIIFFWVARMIFSGIEHMGKIPFSKVMIHGIVRDKLGRKMSKSLGNGIDPLIVIDKYGADSLRFSLANGIAPGGDTRFYEEKVESARNFINKVWNASRFVKMNLEDVDLIPIDKTEKTIADKWILTRLQETAKAVT